MDQQLAAVKADEESELLQELAQSDMESSKPASQFQAARWSALATVFALAVVGVVNMMGSKSIAVADVAATVGLSSWDGHIDHLLKHCKGQCDSAVLIGLDGEVWTGTTDEATKHLHISAQEAQKVASNMKEEPGDFPASGIVVEGTKYMYLKQCNGIITGKKKGQGAISLAMSDQAIIIARTPEEANYGLTNLAVQSLASELKSSGFRRLMRGGETAQYERRLQDDDEDVANVVVDMDSNMIRAGFAGEEAPTVTEPPEEDDFKLRMEQVYDKLEADASKQVVLISETPLTPPEAQQKRTQTLFEDLKVPGMYLANTAALAAVTQGVTTAAVLYMADDAVYAVPIYEMVPLDHATIRESNGKNSADKFAEMVYNSIMKTDVDIRKELYANVVIAGDDAGDDTLGDSLKEKLAELAPPTMKINVLSEDGEDKALTPWIGGSILASLSTFRFITDDMYNEMGPDVVLNTCF